MKILFILKNRNVSWGDSYNSSGLLHSASFVNQMLIDNGIKSNLVNVIDGNCIDREVTKYKPTHVIIEAYWVTPEKFKELKRLHPKITWIVRNHSELAFLSTEGNAIGWTIEYLKMGIIVACNSHRTTRDLENILYRQAKLMVVCLPNYYPIDNFQPYNETQNINLNIGCFGAIRILKNQLIQAVSAIDAAYRLKMKLKFHINAQRIEGNSESVLKNLRQLFDNVDNVELVEHSWKTHKEFLGLIKQMNLGMQVSFSESCNLILCDFVSQGVPVLGSSEVPWLPSCSQALTTNRISIREGIIRTLTYNYCNENQSSLRLYCERSKEIWLSWFKD